MQPQQIMELRAKQIEALRFFQNLIKDDQGVYSIPLTTNLTLRILLDEHFPYTPPRFQVVGATKLSHKLLDPNGYVIPAAHTYLQRWHPQQSLGDLVHSLLGQFKSNEPKPAGGAVAGTGTDGSGRARDRIQLSVPEIPSSFPQLQALSLDQVHELLNNDQQLHAYMLNLDSVATFSAFFVDNTEAREKNAALKGELEQLQVEIQSQQQTLDQHRDAFNQKSMQKLQISERYSPAALATALEEKAHRLEEVLDDQAESFVAHGTFNTTSVTPTTTNMGGGQSASSLSMSTGPDHQFFLDNFFKNWRNDRSQFRVYQLKAEQLRNLNKPRPQFQPNYSVGPYPQGSTVQTLTQQPPLQPQQPQPIQTRTGGGTTATAGGGGSGSGGGGGGFIKNIFSTWKGS